MALKHVLELLTELESNGKLDLITQHVSLVETGAVITLSVGVEAMIRSNFLDAVAKVEDASETVKPSVKKSKKKHAV